MRIDVPLAEPPADSHLHDPDDFTAFDLRVPEHLWIDRRTLVALAGERGADPNWLKKLDAMVEYAAKHGWVDQLGRIRAHVVTGDR